MKPSRSYSAEKTVAEKVRTFVAGGETVGPGTIKMLEKMAGAEGVSGPVVALPDLHYKYSYHTPTGVVVLVKDRIIPKFVNANCGMSFIKTGIFAKDLDEKKTDRIFGLLRSNISVTTRIRPFITGDDLERIVMTGSAWAFERYGLDPEDMDNFENAGSMFKKDARPVKEIMSYIPPYCRDVGLLSMGVLGYGNHFVEMQEVDEVIDADIARKFGISKGQVVFMVHSDSRAFGQSLIDHYSKRAKKLMGLQGMYKRLHYGMLASRVVPDALKVCADKMNYFLNRMKSTVYWKLDRFSEKEDIAFESIDAAGEEGTAYLTGTYAAINFGYANRSYIASVIRDALKNVCGTASSGIGILHDGNHDALQKETIGGVEYFVHRNGAARAYPPQYYPGHRVFSKTGEPVLLPSALGRFSYICAATEGCADAYYSACHGTGRKIDRGEAREMFKADEVAEEIRLSKMKVYDYGRGKIQEESPRAFKDVKSVLRIMEENGIAAPVAKLRPLAALKGWR